MGRPGTGNRAGENILCPLFVSFTDNELRCQSHVPDANACILRYSDQEACRNQRKMYCEGNWKRCEHYLSWEHWRWEDDWDE